LESAVQAGDHVIILTDPKVDPVVSEGAAGVVQSLGATPYVLWIPSPNAYGNEPPALVGDFLAKANVVVAACSTAMTHTDAIRGVIAAGGKYIALGAATFETLT